MELARPLADVAGKQRVRESAGRRLTGRLTGARVTNAGGLMELRDYIRVLLKHWISIVAVTLAGLVGAAAFTFSQPRLYTAQAQSFVALTGNDLGGIAGGATFTGQRLASYVQLASTPDVLQPVIDELRLDTSVTSLAGQVTAANPVDTVLLNISVTNPDPIDAAEIANAVSRQMSTVISSIEVPAESTTSNTTSVNVKVTLVDPAEPPTSPSSPRTTVNLLLGLLIGLAAGVGIAFLRESLDTRVHTPDELVDLTGSAPLGLIGFDPDASADPLVAQNPRASRSEAFRTIRTNLQYVDVDNPPKVIVITSALPLDGKSTTAINLAITFAQAGKRTVVVETDLRRPKASAYLGVESAIGLTDVLAGQIPLEEALVPWNRGQLTLLPAGHVPPNPSELLGSQQMQDVLDALREQFDVVIIDTTPLLPVTDGAVVAKAGDGAILVVRFNRTTREQLALAMESLRQVDARLLGTVLNFVPTRKRGYGYRYGGYYGYGYYGYYGYGGYGTGAAPSADDVEQLPLASPRAHSAVDDPEPTPAAMEYVPIAWPGEDPRLVRLVGYRPAKHADRWEGHRDVCCDLVMRTSEIDAVRDRELLAALHVIFSDSEERELSTDPVDVLSPEHIEECVVRCWRSPAAQATNRTRLRKAAATLTTTAAAGARPSDDGSASGESGDLERV